MSRDITSGRSHLRMRFQVTRHWRPVTAAAALLFFSACSSDLAAPVPATDPSQLYWALELNHHAVNLIADAPYDTVQLVATPRTVDGEALADLPAPTFRSTNIEVVQVSPDGLLQVIKSGSQPVTVIAELTAGGITHADTVLVSTAPNSSPSPLATFSIDPTPPATATAPMGGFPRGLVSNNNFNLPLEAIDQEGDKLTKLTIRYASSDPTVATVDAYTGKVTPLRLGTVSFYASTYAYGVTSVDTVEYTITLPVHLQVNSHIWTNKEGEPVTVFDAYNVRIAVGGRILWSNPTGLPVDITFDDPSNVDRVDELCVVPWVNVSPTICGEGNVEPFALQEGQIASIASRRFNKPGTYTYHTNFGATGTITVVDESQQ